jgi:uncharacterized protein
MSAQENDTVVKSREEIASFCRKHHIARLAFYGSYVRRELKPESDIDVLVEFKPGHVPGLFKLAAMQNQLTELLGRPVDLRTPNDLSPYFRSEVLSQAEVQYES